MKNGYVDVNIKDKVATITFGHPAHNALPANILSMLAGEIIGAGAHPGVQVILLKSGGDRTFCAGASFDELKAITNKEQGKKFFMGFANVINACRTCNKIIVGRIQGKAVGGGVGVASAVDYCLATQYASIRLSELALGIGPFVVGPAVKRKIGSAAFQHMTLNPTQWYSAEWAHQHDLYAAVFESTEELDQHVEEFVDQLKSYSPAALESLKKIFWNDYNEWGSLLEARAEMSGSLILHPDSQAAIHKIKSS